LITPGGDGGNIDVQQLSHSFSGIASIATLASGTGTWRFWTAAGDLVGITDPVNLGSRKKPASTRREICLMEQFSNLLVCVGRCQSPNAIHNGRLGADHLSAFLQSGDFQFRKRFGLPTDANMDGGSLSGEGNIFDQKA
jgi:hypothetical protein